MNLKYLSLTIIMCLLLFSCNNKNMNNPLLTESKIKYGAPAFDKITIEDYLPAFEFAVKEGKEEIEVITNNPQDPSFDNTIKALAYSGGSLNRVAAVFYNLNHPLTMFS